MGSYRKISNGALTHTFISSSFTLHSNCSLSRNQLLKNETHIRSRTHKKTLSQHRAIFTLLQEQSFPTISVPQPRSAEKGEILRKLVSFSTEPSTPPHVTTNRNQMSQTSHLRVNASASGDAERPQLGIGAPEGQKSGSPPARSPASSQQGGRGWVLEAAAGGARVCRGRGGGAGAEGRRHTALSIVFPHLLAGKYLKKKVGGYLGAIRPIVQACKQLL